MKINDDSQLKIIVISGDIHGDVVEELGLELDGLFESGHKIVAIDMCNVSYIYSRGIGILVRAQKNFKEKEAKLYLFNLKPSVQKILMETNLLSFLNGFSTKEEMEFEMGNLKADIEDVFLELGLKIEGISDAKQNGSGDVTLKLSGTIDTDTDISLLIKKINAEVNNPSRPCKKLKLDMDELIYMDDIAVTALVDLSESLANNNIELVFIKANEIILDQIDIMGVLGKFKIEI